jgi:hypothetical protein
MLTSHNADLAFALTDYKLQGRTLDSLICYSTDFSTVMLTLGQSKTPLVVF